MSTKHELTGGWALLRDLSEVTERGRRSVRTIMYKLSAVPGMEQVMSAATGDDAADKAAIEANVEANADLIREHMGESLHLIDEMSDASIMARVKEWSFLTEDGQPLPVVTDSLLDLPGDAYEALKELCKEVPGVLDTEPSPDPKAGTPNSTG